MQSKTESFIESILNTASGFVLSLFLVNTVLPFYGFDVKPGQSLEIVLIFTVASVCRSYIWRRVFNKKALKGKR
ncbi:DUF7220 family protein [Halarcobacter anaerophilus]|jgi:hypothetical protein|uniref:DUF7220 family protein n=1 Tax=Halarcobacter anaerophilus TaxID=877500 RepID=UPI0005C99BCB